MDRNDDRYLHGHHDSVLRSHRWRTAENSAAYLLPHLHPGALLLDVGCGPGTITLDLAARVGDENTIGIDRAEPVLTEARTAAAREGRTVRFAPGDAYALDFDDASLDVVHAHQVCQHLTDPVAALREFRRVTRPDGVVAVRDSDFGGMFWYPADPEMDEWRALYCRVARAVGGEPEAGRHLLSWAHEAGFTSVAVSASAWSFASPGERAFWGGLWADRLTQSDFATQALRLGLAGAEDLDRLAAAWRRWVMALDGCFVVPNTELLCRP